MPSLQTEKIKSVSLPESIVKRIDDYAAANTMSRSEALREFMNVYASGKTKPGRERTTRRITFWAEPDEYKEFMARVNREEVTVAAAIESALGDTA